MFSRRFELRFNTYTISFLLVEVADQKNNVDCGTGEECLGAGGGGLLFITSEYRVSTSLVVLVLFVLQNYRT